MINILLAAGLSLVFTLVGTPLLIRYLIAKKYGQFIREDGPDSHQVKRGTPTMGGLVIVAAVVFGYVVSHLVLWNPPTLSGILLLALTVAMGGLGFLDDWSKIARERSLGLTARAKLIGQFLIGGLFGIAVLNFPSDRGATPGSNAVSLLRDLTWLVLPTVVAVIFIAFLVSAWSNAANLTDGLDGLLSGTATVIFVTYTLITIWQFNQWCGRTSTAGPRCYFVRDPYDLAVVSIALAAACFGFLWWNAKPAKIFMGDTGSMAIGAALAGLSVLTRTELLAVIIGALWVVEAGSVSLQVAYFKSTKGKRLFKMTPIHHHFELKGWPEVNVVIRFWIICGLFVALGVGLFYAEWLVGQ